MMKRITACLIALMLLIQPLCALGEGALPDSSLFLQAAEQLERMQGAFQVKVEYEETDWDSLLEAKVNITWPGTGRIGTAENVLAHITTEDGLYISAGMDKIPLGRMEAGQSSSFALVLGYDREIEKKKEEPEPRLVITVFADNTDYTRYTAVLDGMTEPRVLVMAWENTDVGPRAMQANIDMMADIFSESYYNGQAFEVDRFSEINEETFESAMGRIAGWDEDANDVTYVYINAHGPTIDDVPIAAFQADTDQSTVMIDGRRYEAGGLVPYESLLSYLNGALDGRVVIITEICFSGQLLNKAASMGIDVGKFSIITAAPDNMPSFLWADKTEKLNLNMPFSYGWFTNDLCDLLDAGYAKDANGVVTVGAAYAYLSNAASALQSRLNTAMSNTNDEDVLPGNISGLDDIADMLDVWGERMQQLLDFANSNAMLLLDEAEPMDFVKQSLLNAISWLDPQFGGNNQTLLYCDDPAVDDEKRKIVLIEEKLELFSPVELYYQYLREKVVPEIGVAAINTEVRGDEGYDAAHWNNLNATVGGLLSAVVCNLDGKGVQDMLTIEINALPVQDIEKRQQYFSVDLKLYQIVDGEVVMNDVVEDAIWVNERNRTCSSQTNFRLTEYEGRMMLEGWASFTDGQSYSSGMSCEYGFENGCFADPPARPGAYDMDYFTKDGRAYSASRTAYEIGYQPNGVFRAVNHGEFIAHITYIPYFYPHHKGYTYYAGGITKLEEYLNQYEEEDYFTPLSYVGQPLPTAAPEVSAAEARKAEVEAIIDSAAAPYQERMDSARFRCSVSCKKSGEPSQIRISIGQSSEKAIDKDLLRELCIALVSAEGLNLPADAVSLAENFEYKRNKSKTAGLVEIAMVLTPSDEYIVTITNDRATK